MWTIIGQGIINDILQLTEVLVEYYHIYRYYCSHRDRQLGLEVLD